MSGVFSVKVRGRRSILVPDGQLPKSDASENGPLAFSSRPP